jgi:APA family basic amino acid/polyamine antiporter
MMAALPVSTWIRLAVWTAIGALVYVFYGYHHSKLRAKMAGQPVRLPESN